MFCRARSSFTRRAHVLRVLVLTAPALAYLSKRLFYSPRSVSSAHYGFSMTVMAYLSERAVLFPSAVHCGSSAVHCASSVPPYGLSGGGFVHFYTYPSNSRRSEVVLCSVTTHFISARAFMCNVTEVSWHIVGTLASCTFDCLGVWPFCVDRPERFIKLNVSFV